VIVQVKIEIAFIAVEVTDPAAINELLGHVVGLISDSEPSSPMTKWRNDDRIHRVIVSEGPTNDVVALGFEASTSEDFDDTIDSIRSAGFAIVDGSSSDATFRGVARIAHTMSPWGVRVEVVENLERSEIPFASPLAPGGYLTKNVGFGHAVFVTSDLNESTRFVTEALGMRQSDWIETEIMDGVPLEVHFFHCNARHHSLALAHLPFEAPQKLHHFMFETNDVDDVGSAFDRALAAGLPIASSLGRHDNDDMFSFYVVSPAGFQVEVGHGARLITDDWNNDRRYEKISRWGHRPWPMS
jgi:2,3-dihydroxybiphenyl 1,2-dioxygenase